MIPSIVIRKYKNEDFEPLVRVLEQNIPQYFAESEIEDYRNFLTNELEDYYVLEMEESVVGGGGINYDRAKKIAKLSWDLLLPQYHNQGLGKLLLDHRLGIISKREYVNTIVVRTSQFVYPFYEKSGFKLVETHKDYWAKGFDMYKLVKNK
ncbi:GNAT family N-acetyltransferase [Sphingobacterium thermophilum]|uniref:N-acetyltransferase domain-containing protein n=2 Tax=Sphingobacterium TaxID=28453 RepID=A0ABP8R4K2_9SPHI